MPGPGPEASAGSAGADAQALWGLIMGFIPCQAVCVAAELGVADLLGEGDGSIDELAAACGASAERLARLLGFLTGYGVFVESAPGRFANTASSRLLMSSGESSQRDFAIFIRNLVYPAAGQLLGAVRSGQPAYDLTFGAPIFDHLGRDPEAAGVFTRGMAGSARLRRDVALTYPWPDSGAIVDVGGADGFLLAGVLASRPGLRGIVFDLPRLEGPANERIRAAGLADRCRFVGGDFFEELPTGGDFYLLSTIIHDWADQPAVRILRNCRRVMSPSSRLLILDAVLPPSGRADPSRIMDLVMLTLVTGRERTEAEWRVLLGEAGFELTAITPSWRIALIEAVPRSD